MLSLDNDRITYQYHLCQQCGACRDVCPTGAISFSPKQNGLQDIVVDHDKCIRCSRCVRVCPSRRALDFGPEAAGTDEYLASLTSKTYMLAHNADKSVRRAASSGGAARTLIVESLRSGAVDAVYSLRRTEEFPYAEGAFFTRDNMPGYDDLPTSVYHSVMACTAIKQARRVGRLMIVGTSCQLYAMERAFKGKYDRIVKVCIFCKQQKTLDSTRFIAKMIGVGVPAGKGGTISYRGEGWPVTVTVGNKRMPYHRMAPLPFGHRLWTVPGCNICGDPLGMDCGADISLLDPWTIRRHNDLGDTLAVGLTPAGVELLRSCGALETEDLDFSEAKIALDLDDIRRKRLCVPYFLGLPVPPRVREAGDADVARRRMLTRIVETLPRMPMIFYRVLNRMIRNKSKEILSLNTYITDTDMKKTDVKVMTRHIPSNYGSLLQSIATVKALEMLGCDASIIDYRRKDDRAWRKVLTEGKAKHDSRLKQMAYAAARYPIEKLAEMRFDKMRARYLRTTPVVTTHRQLGELRADLYLTGSDQVWGPMIDGKIDAAYFLDSQIFRGGGHEDLIPQASDAQSSRRPLSRSIVSFCATLTA